MCLSFQYLTSPTAKLESGDAKEVDFFTLFEKRNTQKFVDEDTTSPGIPDSYTMTFLQPLLFLILQTQTRSHITQQIRFPNPEFLHYASNNSESSLSTIQINSAHQRLNCGCHHPRRHGSLPIAELYTTIKMAFHTDDPQISI